MLAVTRERIWYEDKLYIMLQCGYTFTKPEVILLKTTEHYKAGNKASFEPISITNVTYVLTITYVCTVSPSVV
jgi:hypothetical protein